MHERFINSNFFLVNCFIEVIFIIAESVSGSLRILDVFKMSALVKLSDVLKVESLSKNS